MGLMSRKPWLTKIAICFSIAFIGGGSVCSWAQESRPKTGRVGATEAKGIDPKADLTAKPSTPVPLLAPKVQPAASESPSNFPEGDQKSKSALAPDPARGQPGAWADPFPDPTGGGEIPNELPKTDLYNGISHDLHPPGIMMMLVTVLFGILLRQIGYSCFQIGFCRSKVAANIVGKCLLICPLAGIAFWAYGFAIGWGNWMNAPVAPGWYSSLGPGTSVLSSGIGIDPVKDSSGEFTGGYRWGLAGTSGFFLMGGDDPSILTMFFTFVLFLITAATIPIGALAERWSWKNFCVYGLWVALPFSIFANWIWGGGWLTQLGLNWHLGHGAVDFAGSGVVFALGGMIGLAGVMVSGPRPGRYVDGKPIPFPPRYGRLVILGTAFLVLLDVISSASSLWGSSVDPQLRSITVNSLLAILAGGCAAAGLQRLWRRKNVARVTCQGILAGLVAIAAPCAFVEPWAAAFIGALAGVLLVLSIPVWDRFQIDDPVGAISIFGICGLWGVLSVGIFASGMRGAGWNGVDRYGALAGDEAQQHHWQKTVGVAFDGVRGILYGDASQLWAQLIYCTALAAFVFAMAYASFKLSNLFCPVRIRRDDELRNPGLPPTSS